MMNNKKVFVLGLDGATFDLILPWVREGKLPAFSKLISEGVSGKMDSVPNQRSAAAWTSFMTGKNPGKHGIFEFYEYIPSTYNLRFINAKIRDGESLWKILSRHGKKVGVINVPMTYPAEEVNGFLIAGLDAPSVKSEGFTYPQNLYNVICKEFGDYILEPGLTGALVGGRIKEATEMIKSELNQKMVISRYLMSNHSWDFFMVVLRSLDAVQHCFWKYMDSSHPHFNSAESRLYGDTIFNTYQMIDKFLGELMATLDDDTIFMVMSDHGFGQKHPATNQINQWLESKGFLTYLNPSQKNTEWLLGKLYRQIIGKTPRRAKEWLWKTFPSLRDRVQTRLCFANIDWSGTRAYSDSLFPNIRINLKGRELYGIVNPGKENEELIERLIVEVRNIKDLNTGEKIVEDVFRREDIYHGSHIGKSPELLIRWKEDITITGIKIEKQNRHRGAIISPIPGEDYRVISGDHHLQGIFLSGGRDLKKGVRITKGINIMDIVPTILYCMGIPVPDDMDGKIMGSIFEESFLRINPAAYNHDNVSETSATQGPDEYTTEEAEELGRRLRGLGYIE